MKPRRGRMPFYRSYVNTERRILASNLRSKSASFLSLILLVLRELQKPEIVASV